MQLGMEIGKMTRKLFTGFSKSRLRMLNTKRSSMKCFLFGFPSKTSSVQRH